MLDGGQVIVDYLVREKVPYVFGLCDGNIGFIDALYERSDEIKTISVHHETVAGFMADMYYRVCGRPTATFTSCGPGSARRSRSPTPISIPSRSGGDRQRADEPIQPRRISRSSTATIRPTFRPRCAPASGYSSRRAGTWCRSRSAGVEDDRHGAARALVLDVPFDIFKEAAAEETPKPEEWNANISSRCGADPEGVKAALDMLLAAERPVILVGQGVKYGGAAADLLRLAERLRIPVAWSASGTGAIDSHHPLALGLVARNGPYQANHAARTADVLLALGVRFDDRTSSSWLPGYSFTIPPTRLIHVDIDPDEIARNYPVALGLMADVRTFLRQLLAEIESRRDLHETPARTNWLGTIDGYRKQWNAFIAPGFPMTRRRSIRSGPPTRSTRRCPRTPSW